MYRQLMLRQLVMVGVALFWASCLAQGASATISANCASEWPGDGEMQAYCERNQRQAVIELQQMSATNGGIPAAAFRTAFAGCVRDWPEDFEMQAYCLRNQVDGYNTVERGPSSPLVALTSQEASIIAQHCETDWPGDFEMQAYCQRQQADGVAFLRNRPETVPASTWNRAVRACELEWPNDFEMQAYCVRRSFG